MKPLQQTCLLPTCSLANPMGLLSQVPELYAHCTAATTALMSGCGAVEQGLDTSGINPCLPLGLCVLVS